VDLTDADPWALPYAKEIVVRIGAVSADSGPEMSVDERIGEIRSLLEGRTGSSDEERIIELLRGVPPSQAKEILDRLMNEMMGDLSLLDKLDADVHGDNNLLLHEALSLLRMKTLDSAEGAEALADAKVIPWHDVMGFFETSVTFTAKKQPDGKVRVEFIRGPMIYKGTEFSEELDQLPFDMFVGGMDLDPNEILIIHDYDQGRFVPVMAGELIGYQHAGVRKFLSDVGTVAQFAIPVSAARSVAGKVAVYTLERVLPAAVLLVDENRLNLARWFPTWGPKMIQYSDKVKIGIAAYGIASFAVSGYKVFRQWKAIKNARKSMDGPAPSKEAEKVAAQMERHADGIISEAEKIRDAELAAKNADPLEGIDLGRAAEDVQLPPGKAPEAPDLPEAAPRPETGPSAPKGSAPRPAAPEATAPKAESGAGLAKAHDPVRVPQSRAAREAEVMRGVSDDTVEMLDSHPGLKQALIEHPRAAQALKVCNTPCYPDFATEAQIARLERLFHDESVLGIHGNSKAIREFLHQQDNVDDLDRAIGILEGQLAEAAEGRDLAKLEQVAADVAEEGMKGPDQMTPDLPPSSTSLRRQPGKASGGNGLADVTGEWFPPNPSTGARARVGPIPGQVARKLRKIGHFRSFDHFRQTFWKLVADDPVLGAGWNAGNTSRMKQGLAPFAPADQVMGGGSNAKWQLNHKQGIEHAGGVYDLDLKFPALIMRRAA
jgi:hypothetical protein